MKRVFVRLCAVVAVVAAVTTGCAEETSRPGPGSGSGSGARPAAGPGPELTEAEKLRISDAHEVLIKRCMNRAGFSYWTGPRLSLAESRTPGYVSDDLAWARTHGYGSRIQGKVDRARQANPNGTYRARLSAERRRAYDQALDGGSEATVLTARLPDGRGSIRKRLGGCSLEAEKTLYGAPEAWFRADKAAGNLQPLYVPRILRDERFTAALASWAACMKRSGFPYPDPTAAREAAGRAGDFATEVRTAVAEAECARTTGLASVARERQTHYLNALRPEYGETLDTHRRLQRQALERAARITGPRV
ncbi:hypothetical protein [Streptomyces sp. NPDC126499]|uniref:hypothetical protein n=1 Tax=Streptomyces sp. NPDC126499 TaxID=3155314 RepID=UPI0033229B27